MARLIDRPPDWFEECRPDRRRAVLALILRGRGDAEILDTLVRQMIEIVREEGADEGEVETIAAMTRRDLGQILAEFEVEVRTGPEWTADFLDALHLGDPEPDVRAN